MHEGERGARALAKAPTVPDDASTGASVSAGSVPGEAAPSRPLRGGSRQDRQTHRIGRSLFWLVLAISGYFIPRGIQANADSHLALTYALVEHATARVDRYAPYLIDKAAYCGGATVVCTHYYTDKAPGLSLAAAAVYLPLKLVLPPAMMPASPRGDRFLLRYLLTLLVISVWCAAFAAAFWRFMTAFAPRPWALAIALAYAVGSMALPFGMLLFSHALAAALLFWAFMALFRYKAEEFLPHRLPVLAGVLGGFSIGCEYPTAIIVALLGGYAALSTGRFDRAARSCALYILGALAGFAPAMIYNIAVYGSPLSQGYAHLTDPYYAAGMSRGILGVGWPTLEAVWGTTFSPFRGLFFLSPWLLLAIPGLWRLLRGPLRLEALLCIAVVVTYFAFQSGYAFWNGGASVGPRHFLPALPFLAFPIVALGDTVLLRRLGLVLMACSACILLMVVATNPLFGDPHYVKSMQNPLVSQTLHDIATGTWQNNWGMVFGLKGALSLIPLAAVAALLLRRMIGYLHSTEVHTEPPLP